MAPGSRAARTTVKRALATLAGTAACALLGSLPAQAAPVSIGQVAPGFPPLATCTGGPSDAVQVSAPAPVTYTVPPSYTTLTSWSTAATSGGEQMMKLKVYRPVAGLTYQIVAHDGPRSLTPGVINTFPVNIPVQPGDVIGLNDQNATTAPNACLYSGSPGDALAANGPGVDIEDGSPETFGAAVPELRVNVSATLAQPPAVVSLNPTSGSVSGGTDVLISGHDFTGATAVRFGAAAAAAFTVASDGQLSAVSPKSASIGPVQISVITPYGQSLAVPADSFTYLGCRVPKLKGKKLPAAKKKLKSAGCKLGNVKGPKGKKAKVTSQKQKPGAVFPPGGKVGVKTHE